MLSPERHGKGSIALSVRQHKHILANADSSCSAVSRKRTRLWGRIEEEPALDKAVKGIEDVERFSKYILLLAGIVLGCAHLWWHLLLSTPTGALAGNWAVTGTKRSAKRLD